jgi:hypothetical protein
MFLLDNLLGISRFKHYKTKLRGVLGCFIIILSKRKEDGFA